MDPPLPLLDFCSTSPSASSIAATATDTNSTAPSLMVVAGTCSFLSYPRLASKAAYIHYYERSAP